MGTVLLPGLRVRLERVVVPMKVVVLAMKLLKVTLPMLIVMTVGLGMRIVPIMFVPSASGVSSMKKSVTLKPARALSP